HAEEDEHGLPQAPQNVRLHSAAGASKWPPHSPILAPARPGRTRTAVARSDLMTLVTAHRNGPRTPPFLRPSVRAGPAPLSPARSCSPSRRCLEMAPALPHSCAGASGPDAHRCRTLDHALPAHVASKWPPHSPILAPARPGRTRTAVAR